MGWKDMGILFLIVGIVGILWFTGILRYGKYEAFVAGPSSAPSTLPDQSEFNSMDRNAILQGTFEPHYQTQTTRFNRSDMFGIDSVVNGITNIGEKLNAALSKASYGMDGSPDTDYGLRLNVVNTDSETTEKMVFCASLTTFDKWAADNSNTCGWLFLPDSTGPVQSKAIMGTNEGPDPRIRMQDQPLAPLAAGRKWFWSNQKVEARIAEEEKECKRITMCGGLDSTKNCAWNGRTNQMVWQDRSVAADSSLIARAENCPVNQIWCANAETNEARRGCLQDLLKFEGYATLGWLYKNVAATQDTTFSLIRPVIYERAKTPTNLQIMPAELGGVFGSNRVAMDDMRKKLQYLKRLTDSYDPFLADLAQMLVFGSLLDGRVFLLENYFTEAAKTGIGNEDHSALAVDILQREWRKAGCQAAGAGYPTKIESGSLVEKRKEYAALSEQMRASESPLLQKEAIQKCLNAVVTIDTTEEGGDFCNERGVEYFLYDGVGSLAILIGHVYSATGLLTDNGNTKESQTMKRILTSANVFSSVSYKVRTMVSTSNNIIMTPYANWTNRAAYKAYVNKAPADVASIVLETGRRNIFEMEYTGSRLESWGVPRYSFMDMNLDMFQLFQSAMKPFVNFNFYEETYLDSNRLVRLNTAAGMRFVTKGDGPRDKGIQWMSDRVKILPAIRSNMIHIISQRVWLPADANVVLFRLENTANYTETCQVVGNQLKYVVRNGFDAPKEYSFDLSGVREKWVNLAVAFTRNPDKNTLTVEAYVDQRPASSSNVSHTITNETFLRPLDVVILNPEFGSAIMAWFHIYDRKASRVEGFQSGDSVIAILQQEAEHDPQKADTFSLRRKFEDMSNFLVSQLNPNQLRSYTAGPATTKTVPTAVPTVVYGSSVESSLAPSKCPFDAVSFADATNPNYVLGVYPKQKFIGVNPKTNTEVTSAKKCEELCTMDCQAYTFNSEKKECYTYNDLGTNMNTVEDANSFSSIIALKQDRSYEGLKNSTLRAIQEYRNIKTYFKEKNVYDTVFQSRTGFGVFDRTMSAASPSLAPSAYDPTAFQGILKMDEPRTDLEIKRDEDLVKSGTLNKDCLNGIYQKYRIQ